MLKKFKQRIPDMGRKSISHLRKPEILKHTYQIIKEEGLEGASITKIAKRMGINSGIVINNFKNNLVAIAFADNASHLH